MRTLVALILAALATCGSTARASEVRVTRATILAVGDVLLHDSVQAGAEAHRMVAGTAGDLNAAGYDHLYAQVSQYLAAGDLTFANLETPVTTKAPRGKGAFTFNAPIASVKALKRAGVDVVSCANNHAFDQGPKGFAETLTHLTELALPCVGGGPTLDDAWSPRLFGVGSNGSITVAIFGFATVMNEKGNEAAASEPHVAMFDLARAKKAVAAAAAETDVVVVSMHWGVEYETAPRKQQIEWGHALIDAGATIVLGHHPHVLQPIEVYTTKSGRTGVIAFSLGNFIANQGALYGPELFDESGAPKKKITLAGRTPEEWARRRDGMLLRLEIAKTDHGGGLATTELTGVDALPLFCENNVFATSKGPVAIDAKARGESVRNAEPVDIHVVVLERAIENAERERDATDDPAKRKRLDAQLALYRARREAIANVAGGGFLRTLAPASAWPRLERSRQDWLNR